MLRSLFLLAALSASLSAQTAIATGANTRQVSGDLAQTPGGADFAHFALEGTDNSLLLSTWDSTLTVPTQVWVELGPAPGTLPRRARVVTNEADDRVLLSWEEGGDVRGRLFDSAGNAVSAAFTIATSAHGHEVASRSPRSGWYVVATDTATWPGTPTTGLDTAVVLPPGLSFAYAHPGNGGVAVPGSTFGELDVAFSGGADLIAISGGGNAQLSYNQGNTTNAFSFTASEQAMIGRGFVAYRQGQNVFHRAITNAGFPLGLSTPIGTAETTSGPLNDAWVHADNLRATWQQPNGSIQVWDEVAGAATTQVPGSTIPALPATASSPGWTQDLLLWVDNGTAFFQTL